MKIVEVIRSGSSLPVVGEDAKGQKWFIKLIGAGDGTFSSINEWVANRLGLLLGLPVLKPETIEINGSENIQLLDDEGKDLWKKSIGENIAFPFILQSDRKISFSEKEREEIFLYDCLLLNVDRYEKNQNLLYGESKTYATDYGSSLMLRGLLEGKDYCKKETILLLKRNPFYKKGIKPDHFFQKLRSIKWEDANSIIERIPSSWMEKAGSKKKELADRLFALLQDSDNLKLILSILDSTDIAESDNRNKARLNRMKFETKLRTIRKNGF
ncbi:hypothetical protein PB1_13104 [Bacillus methanolicus PB1]|uniref:HipA-like kinase domain-containing protein n=1 Tax=Bacillus methanolicus PB1 TaxID=997296 RepID=I3DW76_BACMT|nr:HipA family kinase [Bacillus methanolicus]EIJ78497.1 hypothetical protein PB1_13104 [Bacillus methanolicus PB1]